MAFNIIASSFEQKEIERAQWQKTAMTGFIFGFVALYFNFVGLMTQFVERWIIEDVLTLAHVTLMGVALFGGVTIAIRSKDLTTASKIVNGAAVGAMVGIALSLLMLFMTQLNVRFMFVALSNKLFLFLSWKQGLGGGIALQIALGAGLGALGVIVVTMPKTLRKPLVWAFASVFFIGLFSELIQLVMQYEFILGVRDWFFSWEGQRLQGAIVVFVVAFTASMYWTIRGDRVKERYGQMSASGQKSLRYFGWGCALILFLLFPAAAGSFFGQVMMYVGLFILMGMGLNLELGLAGLLDLGFVAFFAAGAYTIALFTGEHELQILLLDRPLTWWEALPLAVLVSVAIGFMFGIPVLKVRGDYLAVATMGLGEIIRVVVLSDMAAPLLGGSQGMLHIPRPILFGWELNDPIYLFYLTLVCASVAGYFAWALENSRLGRAWMAIREDEDVGQALGINLINVKLLAYGLGAAFAGLAGAIFAVMLTSIFPHSFQLLISINILALLIVGGLGSLPGVVVGAAMLIGTPELLREFGEYRFLAYGAVLIAMMRIKPIGLWPSAARKREIQSAEEIEASIREQMEAEGQRT
ncbi:MAG: branched-chain amino acid ABC transporter permease [Rhodospirillaceae bacterium]|nr:branched-chain amino acid ABC transporter permease [Rhodospirillaceae bacterium]